MSDDGDSYYEYALWRHFREIQERGKKEPEWAKELLQREPEEQRRGADPLSQYLEASVEHARRALRQFEHEVYVREKLHEQAISQIDYQITEAAHSLTKFKGVAAGYNRGVDNARLSLEHQLDSLRREKRAARLRFWDDLVTLRDRVRELRRQYETAKGRSQLRLGD